MVAPYDLIAARWARDRAASSFCEKSYIDRLSAPLFAGARILDLGFGSGRPIGRYLLDQGFRLTGVDASQEMLRLGAANCPEAELVWADLLEYQPTRSFDAVIAWDSVFHISKDWHAALFRSIHEWLVPNGGLLISLGGSEDEFTDLMYGVEFFYSAHAPDASVALLQAAGFDIVLAEIDDPTSRGHMAILGRKLG